MARQQSTSDGGDGQGQHDRQHNSDSVDGNGRRDGATAMEGDAAMDMKNTTIN
jgi:hypothetical protein